MVEAPESANCAQIAGGAKTFERITELKELEPLWCFDLNRKKVELISQIRAFKYLFMETVRASGALAYLSQLDNLTVIQIDTCSKEETRNWLSGFPLLDGLGVVNFKNVRDTSEIANQHELKFLSVSGSMWTRMKIDSLDPIRQ